MIHTKQEWKIGDCLELLPSIETGSIDMILTDLPYGATACSWDHMLPIEKLWNEYRRITKENAAIILFLGFKDAAKHILLNEDIYRYDLVWEKSNPANIVMANKRPMQYHENIFVFYKSQPIYNKQMIKRGSRRIKQAHKNNYVAKASSKSQTGGFISPERDYKIYDADFKNPSSIIRIPSIKGNSDEFVKHPTQKPIALFEYLIKTYTNEGDWVHDSCLGSGTTLEACRNTNRNCIGFEISDEWEHLYPNRCLSHTPPLDSYV